MRDFFNCTLPLVCSVSSCFFNIVSFLKVSLCLAHITLQIPPINRLKLHSYMSSSFFPCLILPRIHHILSPLCSELCTLCHTMHGAVQCIVQYSTLCLYLETWGKYLHEVKCCYFPVLPDLSQGTDIIQFLKVLLAGTRPRACTVEYALMSICSDKIWIGLRKYPW